MSEASEFFEFIERMEKRNDEYNVTDLCSICGVSRSGYYAWKKAAPLRGIREEQDRQDFEQILHAYVSTQNTRGARTLAGILREEQPPVVMNVKKIRRLMHKYNLVRPRSNSAPYRDLVRDTVGSERLHEDGLDAYGPRKVLLTDIASLTYGNERTVYFCAILDPCTSEVLGGSCSTNLDDKLVCAAFEDLREEHGSEFTNAVVAHSDKGRHYMTCLLDEATTNRDFLASMRTHGSPWENQRMEFFFAQAAEYMSEALANSTRFEQVEGCVREYIRIYNNEWYQWELAKLTPAEYYEFCRTGVYPANPSGVPAPVT